MGEMRDAFTATTLSVVTKAMGANLTLTRATGLG